MSNYTPWRIWDLSLRGRDPTAKVATEMARLGRGVRGLLTPYYSHDIQKTIMELILRKKNKK